MFFIYTCFCVFEVAYADSLQVSKLQWNVLKSLGVYNSEITKETAQGIFSPDVAQKLGRHADTVKRFLKDHSTRNSRSDRGVFKTVMRRDLRKINRQLSGKPRLRSKRIVNVARLSEVHKTTQNRLLKIIAVISDLQKVSPLTPGMKNLKGRMG